MKNKIIILSMILLVILSLTSIFVLAPSPILGQLNWYPLETWEKRVCAETFTSDYFLNNPNGGHSDIIDERIYDLTIAADAELRNTSFIDEDGNSEYLLNMGWYIQGLNPANNKNVKYKILLMPNRDYLDLGEGTTEKEFTLSTGESDYYSAYTTEFYASGRLILDISGRSETYNFNIINIKE